MSINQAIAESADTSFSGSMDSIAGRSVGMHYRLYGIFWATAEQVESMNAIDDAWQYSLIWENPDESIMVAALAQAVSLFGKKFARSSAATKRG